MRLAGRQAAKARSLASLTFLAAAQYPPDSHRGDTGESHLRNGVGERSTATATTTAKQLLEQAGLLLLHSAEQASQQPGFMESLLLVERGKVDVLLAGLFA